jgi:tight adherence protein C
MSPIITGIGVGSTITTGLVVMWRGARPPKPVLGDLIRNAGQRHVPQPTGLWNQTINLASRTGDNDTLTADLVVLGRTRNEFAASRIQLCVALGALPIVAAVLTSLVSGSTWNPTIIALCALSGVGAGVALSKVTLASEAAGRRKRFIEELAAYLDIVAQLVAGGAGIDEALWRAVRSADTPGLVMMRDTIASARVRRRSEWAELGVLANRARLPELDELASAIELASTDGARIRASLQAKAKSLRAATASEQLASANRASEAMGGPLIGMLLAFLVVVLAPALAQVLAIN